MDPAILTTADWHKSLQAWQAAKDAGKRVAFDPAATAMAAYRIVSGVLAQPYRGVAPAMANRFVHVVLCHLSWC